MKIITWFLLFNFVKLNLAELEPRNMFTDFIDYLIPGRIGRQYSHCECGLNKVRTGRVVNGTVADNQPWHAALYIETTKQQFCSATLINSRWLVTAYHCLMDQTTSTLRILMGTNMIGADQVAKDNPSNSIKNLLEENDNYLEQRENKRSLLELLYQLDENGNKTFFYDSNQLNPFFLDSIKIFKAKRFVFNREFEKTYFKNDIALIELDRDVSLSDSIRPICLINQSLYLNNDEYENLINNVIVKGFDEQPNVQDLKNNFLKDFDIEEKWLMEHQFDAFGFGRTGYNKAGSSILQKVTFNYERLDECKKAWESKISLYGGLIDEGHFCVMNKYSTICHGDSGTALTLKLKSIDNLNDPITNQTMPSYEKEKNYLVGIASAGYYCSLDIPVLFTRLSRQLDFVYSYANSGYWCKK